MSASHSPFTIPFPTPQYSLPHQNLKHVDPPGSNLPTHTLPLQAGESRAAAAGHGRGHWLAGGPAQAASCARETATKAQPPRDSGAMRQVAGNLSESLGAVEREREHEC